MRKVVAHYQDGNVVKGLTGNFLPGQDRFHMLEAGATMGSPPLEIRVRELKGLFFVNSLVGDPGRAKSNLFDPADRTPGHRIRVQFMDGEVMNGFTTDYAPGRMGFFVHPADLHANTARCYVVASAVADITFLQLAGEPR